MSEDSRDEFDSLMRQFGASQERVRRLQQQLARQAESQEAAAREWLRLRRHQIDLAEWLIDQGTNDSGAIVRPVVDAGLGSETYVPCSITATVNDKRYRIDLVSTAYLIQEISANG